MQLSYLTAATLGAMCCFLPWPAAAQDNTPMDAGHLLDDCLSPASTGRHAVCMVIVGSVMDGIDVAAVAARKQHKVPAICLPPDLDREAVISRFAMVMGSGNGAYDGEKATIVLGAILMTYPCK